MQVGVTLMHVSRNEGIIEFKNQSQLITLECFMLLLGAHFPAPVEATLTEQALHTMFLGLINKLWYFDCMLYPYEWHLEYLCPAKANLLNYVGGVPKLMSLHNYLYFLALLVTRTYLRREKREKK